MAYYAKDRFFKSDATIEHYLSGKKVREPAMIYSYETHKDLYDVTVTDTSKRVYFSRNMRNSTYLPVHEEIMLHFRLEK
jgi:hypothetical protein